MCPQTCVYTHTHALEHMHTNPYMETQTHSDTHTATHVTCTHTHTHAGHLYVNALPVAHIKSPGLNCLSQLCGSGASSDGSPGFLHGFHHSELQIDIDLLWPCRRTQLWLLLTNWTKALWRSLPQILRREKWQAVARADSHSPPSPTPTPTNLFL